LRLIEKADAANRDPLRLIGNAVRVGDGAAIDVKDANLP